METSRSGRARKKTAKMLEMEEAEEEFSYAVKVRIQFSHLSLYSDTFF